MKAYQASRPPHKRTKYMHKIISILHASLQCARANLKWWLLALLQIIAMLALVMIWEIFSHNQLGLAAGVPMILFFSVLTSYFWLVIKFAYEKNPGKIQQIQWFNAFLRLFLVACALIFVSGLMKLGLKIWVFRALILSFLSVFALSLALGGVLITDLRRSFWVVASLWQKKSGVMSWLTCFLLINHAYFFVLGKLLAPEAYINQAFSGSQVFATIILLVGALIVLLPLVAWLNAFVVIGYLEIIRPTKAEPEKIESNIASISEVVGETGGGG